MSTGTPRRRRDRSAAPCGRRASGTRAAGRPRQGRHRRGRADTRRRRARHRRCRRRRRCEMGRCRARRPVRAATAAPPGSRRAPRGTGARAPSGTPRWRRTRPPPRRTWCTGRGPAPARRGPGRRRGSTAALRWVAPAPGGSYTSTLTPSPVVRASTGCAEMALEPSPEPSHETQCSVAPHGRDRVEHRAPQIVGDAIEPGPAIDDPTKTERTEGDHPEQGEAAHEPDHADHHTRRVKTSRGMTLGSASM